MTDSLQRFPKAQGAGEGVDTSSWDRTAPPPSFILRPTISDALTSSMSTEAGAVRPDVALTFLCPLQTDCALWAVQLQRQLPGQEVGRDLSAELTAVEGDAALRLCGERGRRLRAFLHLDPGCPRVRPPPRTLAARGYDPLRGPWLPAGMSPLPGFLHFQRSVALGHVGAAGLCLFHPMRSCRRGWVSVGAGWAQRVQQPRPFNAFQNKALNAPRPCLASRRISSELHSNLPKFE